MFDDRSADEVFADAVSAAKSAFDRRARELGDPHYEGIAAEAMENVFAVETYAEYTDDLQRWDVALTTLNMLADR